MPVMLSFVSSAANTLLPELFKNISWFLKAFFDEKRKYRITELPFKGNINEQLSIATDDIVYIFIARALQGQLLVFRRFL